MKTLADIRSLVLAEVAHFIHRNEFNPYAEGYLYYCPTTPERDGEIIVASTRPGLEWELVTPERIRPAQSPEGFVQHLTQLRILAQLPVLPIA